MKTAAVSESKVRLSGFLRQVKAGSNVEREGGLGLGKEQQLKVGCCGFAAAQKKYFELFNNNTMKDDALRFVKALGMR